MRLIDYVGLKTFGGIIHLGDILSGVVVRSPISERVLLDFTGHMVIAGSQYGRKTNYIYSYLGLSSDGGARGTVV